jgi:hypothetical protein
VNLEKRRLKHVLRHLGVAEVATEITEQLLLIPLHERLEGRRILIPATAAEQFLIGKPADHTACPGSRSRHAVATART